MSSNDSTKHSPGPWHWVGTQAKPKAPIYLVHGNRDNPRTPYVLCQFEGQMASVEDARLIASAPDLLAACEESLRFVGQPNDAVTPSLRGDRLQDQLEAAIKKAGGSA